MEVKENNEKMCPMTFNLPKWDSFQGKCAGKRCAWWVVYYKGKPNEYGECAIVGISNLADLIK